LLVKERLLRLVLERIIICLDLLINITGNLLGNRGISSLLLSDLSQIIGFMRADNLLQRTAMFLGQLNVELLKLFVEVVYVGHGLVVDGPAVILT
jgi:hypothetical protein